jgi:hypothetical protein
MAEEDKTLIENDFLHDIIHNVVPETSLMGRYKVLRKFDDPPSGRKGGWWYGLRSFNKRQESYDYFDQVLEELGRQGDHSALCVFSMGDFLRNGRAQ